MAEGAGRGSDPDFCRFLWHSMGSCNELEYDLFLARDLTFLPQEEHTRLTGQLVEVRRMLTGLIGSVKQHSSERREPATRPGNRRLEAGSWKLETGSW